jgi:hypothetical protein
MLQALRIQYIYLGIVLHLYYIHTIRITPNLNHSKSQSQACMAIYICMTAQATN